MSFLITDVEVGNTKARRKAPPSTFITMEKEKLAIKG